MAVEQARGQRAARPSVSSLTCGVCELEGDGFVRDAADVADGHLARVAGVILGPQVLQLQDFGFTLAVGNKEEKKRQRCTKHSSSLQVHNLSQSLLAAPIKTSGNCADSKPP